MSDGNTELPFGKHEGERIRDVPVSYLDWLIGQDWLDEDLREDVEAFLEDDPEWRELR